MMFTLFVAWASLPPCEPQPGSHAEFHHGKRLGRYGEVAAQPGLGNVVSDPSTGQVEGAG